MTNAQVEVITSVQRRRRWSSEEKRRIYEEELALLHAEEPPVPRAGGRTPKPAWMGPLIAVIVAVTLGSALLFGVTRLWSAP